MKKWMMRILLGVGLAFWCIPATAQTAALKGNLRGSPAHGWIFDDRNRHSDFPGGNRTQELPLSNSGADEGTVRDASAGAGYAFAPGSGKLRIIPLAGYSYQQQNPAVRDVKQAVSQTPGKAGLGLFGALDSVHETERWEPWIGLDLDFRASDRIMIFSVVENRWDSVTILIGTTYRFNW